MQIANDAKGRPPALRMFVPGPPANAAAEDRFERTPAALHPLASPGCLRFPQPPKNHVRPRLGPAILPQGLRWMLGLCWEMGQALWRAVRTPLGRGLRWLRQPKPVLGCAPFVSDGATVRSLGCMVLLPHNDVAHLRKQNRALYIAALKNDKGFGISHREMLHFTNHYGVYLRVWRAVVEKNESDAYHRVAGDEPQASTTCGYVDWLINDEHEAMALFALPSQRHAQSPPPQNTEAQNACKRLKATTHRKLHYGTPQCCIYVATAYASDMHHARAFIDAWYLGAMDTVRQNDALLAAYGLRATHILNMSDGALYRALDQQLINKMHADWVSACQHNPDLVDKLVEAALLDAQLFCQGTQAS